ncbi:LVIVD repeat-containing protein [Solirubrobacter pauli]|uniref:LVIVD repeat-containing protein n=2 Tax=Solirubrobacter pauli TaxID=166793 RepID=A0A660L584_9ACTN|nr:LVIVD repeat-containing protein [Solirubrobacter pauli]
MFTGDVARQIGAYQGGASMFMQRAPETPGALTLVGHNPLENRGMNAAIAVNKGFVYVGSRTDGSQGRDNAGIKIIDASNPARPVEAGEMLPPLEGNKQESSRELRVWRSQDVLIVLHTNCGGQSAHLCEQPSKSSMRFYDIKGKHAADPQLLHQNTRDTHEFFIWEDPKNPQRALMFEASAGRNLKIYDLSPLLNADAATREPKLLFDGPHGFGNSSGSGIHSFSVSNDGTRAYFALLTRGFGVVDVSDFTDTDPATNTYRLVTPPANRVQWEGPGAHSAIKLWNKDAVYVSDEVYGTATAAGHGCPWGWTRFVDIADPTKPAVVGDYRLPENQPLGCATFNPPRTSYSAHNPTLTPNIAFSTWHSGGVQAMDISDPRNVRQLAEFKPQPLATVGAEDPRLSSDTLPDRTDNKVVMWSYPVIEDGLIYVVDLRNGLYILEYTGPYEREVRDVKFLEGNSNQGDALCFEPVPGAARADCSRSAEGTVGGSVPATLSLTLGAPGSFGTFVPGTAGDYFAKTDAKVTSTVGAALLTAADPSAAATGHLVNGAFSLPQPVQVKAGSGAATPSPFAPVGSSAAPTPLLSYSGPVSNDEVTFDFKQSIAAGDALRTGTYSKPLTFTLSTTTP